MYSNISVLYTLYKNTLLSLCHNFKSAFFHYQYLFYKLKKYPCIFNNFIFCVVVDNQFAYLYNVTCNKNRLVLSLEITSANGQETNKHVMENVCFRYLKPFAWKTRLYTKNVDFGCAPLISGNKENRYQMYNSCSGGKHFKYLVISLYNCLTLTNQT